LLSINGTSMEKLLAEMLQRDATDGMNRTGTYWRLEQEMCMMEIFALQGERMEFEIEYLPAEGEKTQKANLRAISYRKRMSEMEKFPSLIDVDEPFRFELFEADSTALMTIQIFSDYFNPKIKLGRFLSRSFETLQKKKVKNLILDLRDNSSGDDIFGALLYSYLTDSSFRYYEAQYVLQKKYSFLKDTDDQSVNNQIAKLKKQAQDDGTFRISLDGLDYPQLPNRPNFSGNLYVLINGGTQSVACELASIIKQNGRGMILGEESGSTFTGSTSGFMPYLVLPHSSLQLCIPLVKYVMAVPQETQNGRGVEADQTISMKPEDLVNEKDRVLETLWKLIRLAKGN
jgi:C-terminal processing protease CtpA/Prc